MGVVGGAVVAAGASVFCGGGPALADESAGRNIGLVVVDNSSADSLVAIDHLFETDHMVETGRLFGTDHIVETDRLFGTDHIVETDRLFGTGRLFGTDHMVETDRLFAADRLQAFDRLPLIDNSSADSWLEVDRTLNTLMGSRGTAGSDHDGGGGAIDVRTGDTSGALPGPGSGAGRAAEAEPEQSGPGTGSRTATAPGPPGDDEGDDDEGDADTEEPEAEGGSGGGAAALVSPLSWVTQIGHPMWQGESGD